MQIKKEEEGLSAYPYQLVATPTYPRLQRYKE